MMQEYESEYLDIVEKYFGSMGGHQKTWEGENFQKFITDAKIVPDVKTVLKDISLSFER